VEGQKGQIHPAFNFKVGRVAKACEEGLDGQSGKPEPQPKAAAESALAVLTAPFTFTADKHVPGRLGNQVYTVYIYNP